MNTVWIVLPVLIALMFQLGIELDRQAFAGVARRPAAVVAGLLGQLALLPLIAFGVGQAIYNFRNAKGENRYSAFDIVDSDEEDDPLNRRYGARHEDAADSYCPYCGAPAEEGFAFCRRCGKKLPK
mgnify:CR=1 FL=1